MKYYKSATLYCSKWEKPSFYAESK